MRVSGAPVQDALMGAGSPARRRTLWIAAAAAVALLLGGAVALAGRVVRDRYAVPSADLLGSPTAPATPTPRPTPSPTVGVGITGPLDILLVGLDTRVSVPG